MKSNCMLLPSHQDFSEKLFLEGRSAFEHELSVENGVFVEFDEQLAQAENLLKILGRKVSLHGEFTDLCGAEFHVGTELVREGENVSGTISFHVGTERCPGRLSNDAAGGKGDFSS